MLELYDGKSLSDTGKIVKRSKPTIERWLQQWNKDNYKGLMVMFQMKGTHKFNEK